MKTTHLPPKSACLVVSLVAVLASRVAGTSEAQPLIELDSVSLNGAISNLARSAKLNYILDPRASAFSVGPNYRLVPEPGVSYRWKNLTPEQALNDLLGQHKLKMITNPATSVGRIVLMDQSVEPVPASQVGSDTNAVVPVIHLEYVPLAVAISEIGKKAQLQVSINPQLPVPSSGPTPLTIATTITSVHWESIRPKQALVALLDSCDLALVEDPAKSSARVVTKQINPEAIPNRSKEGR